MAKRPRKTSGTRADDVIDLYNFLTGVHVPVATDEKTLPEKLAEADRLFSQGGGVAARLGMIAALHAVLSHVEDELDEKQLRLLRPLRRLTIILEDLNDGRIDRTLQTSRKAGGTRVTKDDAEFRLLAILVVDALITGGMDECSAGRYVAAKLTSKGFFKQRRSTVGNPDPITAGTLLKWRNSRQEWLMRSGLSRSRDFRRWLFARITSVEAPRTLSVRASSGRAPAKYTGRDVAEFLIDKVLPAHYGHLRYEK